MRSILITAALACSSFLSSIAYAEQVNIYSFRQSFLIDPILAEFSKESGIETKVIFAKDGLIQRIKREGELSPADVVLTSNFSKLLQLKEEGLVQSFELSDTLKTNIPQQFRDSDNSWLALTQRVRNIYSSKKNAGDLTNIRYEDLADEKFKGRICTRSGKHPYNLGLIASMIAHNGEAETEKWLTAVKSNLARKPQGGDRDQIKALAGCDRLTIAPKLLDQLGNESGTLPRALSPDNASGVAKIAMDEKTFRWDMNSDAMATEKLAEGIRNFDADHKKLIALIADRMA